MLPGAARIPVWVWFPDYPEEGAERTWGSLDPWVVESKSLGKDGGGLHLVLGQVEDKTVQRNELA